MVARGVGRELAASVAAHRDILYRIQHPCGMIIPCFSPVVNTFFCGFGGSRNFRDIVTKTTGYSGVVWLKGRPGRHGGKGRTTRPAGGLPGWLPADLAAAVPSGGRAFFVACQPCLWFALSPPSPAPLPLRGRGRLKVYFAGGFAPGTPALNRLRHLQSLPYRFQAQGSLRFGVKPTERLSLEQCRQPRRGGTGGDGTIRRKRRRRLRWSSPPGQGEPMPAGFSPLPLGTANARRASEARAIPRAGNNTGSKTAATP